MSRYKLTIEYDGSGYVGWQRQDNGPSIQQALEQAVAAYCQEEVIVYGAGRTDAGVHALGQVVHVDLRCDDDPAVVANAMNAHLRPQPISVLSAERVGERFHARFSATRRTYAYRIINRKAPLTVEANRAWRITQKLDLKEMERAAKVLVGHHDFSSFRASECQAKSPLRTLEVLSVSRLENCLTVKACAPSFLHHQVRNIVGTLRLVGQGKWNADYVKKVLAARDRGMAGPTAPACGLYLISIDYS